MDPFLMLDSWASTSTPMLDIFARLFLAAALGAVVGLERELKSRPAGLRTHMLTSIAAATFTILTLEIYLETVKLREVAQADPLRLIEAVTTGVSFLAAGTIIHGSGKVEGLTTGASIWMAGAIGVACGSGFFLIAATAVVLTLIVTLLASWFERAVLQTKESQAAAAKGEADRSN